MDNLKNKRLSPESNPIRDYIYNIYTPMKQNEDERWTSFHKIMLSANGVDMKEIDKAIITVSQNLFNNKTTLNYEVDKYPQPQQESVRKLFKIGARSYWAFVTLNEMVSAIKENRKPNLKEFPTFGGKTDG